MYSSIFEKNNITILKQCQHNFSGKKLLCVVQSDRKDSTKKAEIVTEGCALDLANSIIGVESLVTYFNIVY